MAVNIFELARQFGGVLEEPKDQQIDPAELAKQFGGEVIRQEEEPAQAEAPKAGSFQELFGRPITQELASTYRAAAGPAFIAQDIGEGGAKAFAPETYTNTIENLKLNAQLTADINELRIIDKLPDSPKKQELQQQSLAKIRALQEQIQVNTPEDLNILQRGIRGAIETLPPMLLGTAASVATRNPAPALSTAGVLTGLQSYGEARVAGKDPNIALSYGSTQAAIEVITEVAPLDRLIKAFGVKDVSGLKDQLLAFAKKEIPSEQAATLGQTLNSLLFGLDEELANAQSPAEAAKIQAERQAVTAVATIVAGGVQAGSIGAANRIREEVVRRDIESQVRDLEDVGTEIEKRELQKLRDQAFKDAQTIAAPELPEVTPLQYGDAYAQKIYDSVGQYIPINAEFKVEEKVVDDAPRFVVTDKEGTQYGQTLQDKTQADAFAVSLNNTTKSRAELVKQLEPLQSSLTETLKGFGLNDVGLTLSDRIFTRRGEALTSEGLFDPVVRRVFLAVDAADPQGNLDTPQRREALRGVLRHEVVHALRYLDLWKSSEWKNLESAVSRLKKPGTDKTYLQVAQEAYADQSPVIQVEEAVAELIRDVAGNISKVAGKPRNLSERAINFFDKAKNALTGAGFQTYEDIVQRFERGDIGARERGRIRTFRATEEQQAARGEVPERVQRLFTSPEERNQFRAETVQKAQTAVPATTAPAINALRLNAVRESRSTIDPVPPKIKVDDQEFPTTDSEGRLIYSGYEGPEVFGIQTRPTMEGLQNFWRSFKGSKAVDKQNRPQLYLHGTAGDITAFRPKQAGAVFLTRNIPFAESFGDLSNTYMITNFPDFIGEREVLDVLNESMRSSTTPQFYDRLEKIQKRVSDRISQGKPLDAKSITDIKELYTGKKVLGKTGIAPGVSSRMIESIEKRLPSNANLVPVYVNAQNPFDYENKDDVKRVIKRVKQISPIELDSTDIEGLNKGDWVTIEGLGESSPILDAIKDLGYDSMYIEESGIKNLAVFNPNQIKSAIGNNGNFDVATPSIRESRKQPTYNIINRRTGEVVGQANTLAGARRAVDRRDNQYGGYVHQIQVMDAEADRLETNKDNARLGLPLVEEGEFVVPRIRLSRISSPGVFEQADIGINVRSDQKSGLRYADEIVDGNKKYETRDSDSLRPYVGKRIAIVRTGEGTAKAIGEATVGEPIVVDEAQFNRMRSEHLVPAGSAFDIKPGSKKYLYPMLNPVRFDEEKDVGAGIVARKVIDRSASIRESRKFPAKSTPEDTAMAEEYLNRTGELPYLSEGQLEPVVPVARQSIKKPYEAKDLAKGRENDPISGLPLNKDGTVTLYFPATNEVARRTIQDKRLRGATPESNRIYLTNESSGPRVMENPGNIDQPMDGANVMIHVDPSLIHFDQEFADGRKDFFVQLAEGKSYADKMRQTRLFTLDAPRTRALSVDTKLVDLERSVTNSINNYLSLNAQERKARLKQAREVLKTEHNVGTLMGENGKLQKTRIGDYGLTYDGKSVASMGLGLASAQRINEQNLSTCPLSAMCEGLCLGETSGQNQLYGGEGQFRSGPRLSQYLKTEALVQHPEEFAVVLYDEIAKFEKWANSERGMEQIENEAGEKVMQPKQVYQPAIRLNVTSDFRPQTFASIIGAFPNVMFYDYTKLPTRSIASNHHLTYSSTGASQVVNGETIINPGSNWDKMVQRLNEGLNVAMAFTSRKDMPDFVVDERTGQRFQVWNGDNYDARFLDPKREDGVGMIVGLTNKDKTTKPEEAANKYKGFFLDYDRARDGDTLTILNQGRLRISTAPATLAEAAAIVPRVRESRRPGTPIGPEQPGPSTDTDNSSAAEALNNGQPVNSVGIPTGPQIDSTMPDGTVDISEAKIAPLMQRLIIQMIQGAPDKLRSGMGLDDLGKRIENYYDGFAAKLGMVNGVIFDAFRELEKVELSNPVQMVLIARENKRAALETFERFIRARENKRTEEAQAILNEATEKERKLIDAWIEIARITGEVNTRVRAPNGQPMKVWDAKVGKWRAIRSVENFFPRTFRKEVMAVMKNPDLDPALWQELLEAIVQSGKAGNQAEAREYLLRKYFSNEVKQDYFSGVEKARNEALPEIFYDYSWDAATRYLRKWARRTSQIENFGQTTARLNKTQMEWFDRNIPDVMDTKTQEYLNDIRNIIYEVGNFDVITNLQNWGGSLATGLFLGNPVTSGVNFAGGTLLNMQEFGAKEISKAYLELMKNWGDVQIDGTTLGILNKDFLNILNDHIESDVDKYFGGDSREQIKIPKTKYTPEIKFFLPESVELSRAFAKFANVMLTFGGYNASENVVRAAAMLASRARLKSWLDAVNENRESPAAKDFFNWVQREKLDAETLIIENGAGPETEKYMRRAVNVPQGSYDITMTPVFANTQFGRFFLKFQKFGTQVNRYAYNHFLKPFFKDPNPKTLMRMLSFIGYGIVGGAAVAAFREALGYGDPGPDYDELEEALKDKELVVLLSLLWSRAYQDLVASGILGFFGNYAQMGKDFLDQDRVKNPFQPPGIASINAFLELYRRGIDQKKLTARDLDEIVESSFSFYRANKRITLAAMDAIGVDFREVRRFAAQKEVREVREYGRRYSEAMDIEFKRRTAPGTFAATPMTPVNKAVSDALLLGDASRARAIINRTLAKLPPQERQRAMASIRAAVRNRQPIQIGGKSPNQESRKEFMLWARKTLPSSKYRLIIRVDRRYRNAARQAGLGFSEE